MNIRQFECFIVLAEELNFRRAAERCIITQPALSQMVRQMELELQATLFSRTNRQVRLTPAGEVFLIKAREIVSQVRETKRLVEQIEGGKKGNIAVGATVPAIYIVFSDIANEMRRQLPDVELSVSIMDTQIQEEEVRNGRIDIGIGHTPFEDETLAATHIARVPFAVAMAKDNPLTGRKKLLIEDLKEETFVLFPRNMAPLQHDSIIALCLEAGFSPRHIIDGISPAQAIIAYAGAGMGIGFIASKLQQFKHPNVLYRQLEGNRPYFTLGTVHRRENMNPVIRTFIRIAQEVGRRAK